MDYFTRQQHKKRVPYIQQQVVGSSPTGSSSKTAQYRYWPEKARSYAGFFVGKGRIKNSRFRRYFRGFSIN